MQANDKLKHIGHYERELRVASELSREAGAAILEHYEGPLDIEQKFSADDLEPVTQADRVANQLIVERLAREFPKTESLPKSRSILSTDWTRLAFDGRSTLTEQMASSMATGTSRSRLVWRKMVFALSAWSINL